MLDYIKQKFHAVKKDETFEKKLELFQANFFNLPYHSWITESKALKRAFFILFDSLNEQLLSILMKKKLICLRSYGVLACTLSIPPQSDVLIVYPDLIKLLNSASLMHGVSILAHELGHIILDHSHNDLNPVLAQLEADAIAFEMGFGKELMEQIKSFPTSYEYKLRIKNLANMLSRQV